VCRGGTWWKWSGDRWLKVDEDKLQLMVYRAMGDLWHWEAEEGEEQEAVRVKQSKRSVEEVLFALRSVVEVESKYLPVWLDRREEVRADECVAFRDVVVRPHAGGVQVVALRDQNWLGPVVPADWVGGEGAQCPLWEKCLDDWRFGEVDKGNLKRFMGYLLMGKRDQRKSLLLQGVAGGGKGVVKHVVEKMVGGSWFRATDIQTLVNGFGLAGIQDVTVLAVEEMGDEGRGTAERFSSVWKQLLGEDAPPINDKFQRIKWNEGVRVAVVMSSNQIPKMANQGQGVSNKLVVLPFTRSFDNRAPDTKLREKLEGEMEGIARWAVEGAVELMAMVERGENPWPVSEGAQGVMEEFGMLNSPMDGFLEDRFVRSPTGYVGNEVMKREWRAWVKQWEGKEPRWVRELGERNIPSRAVGESSWGLVGVRMGRDGGRGVRGLSLRKVGP